MDYQDIEFRAASQTSKYDQLNLTGGKA